MTGEAQPHGARQQWAWRLFQATLFTLPWIGMGVMTLATGRDLGAGLQPSWLLMTAVVLLSGPELLVYLGRQRRFVLVFVLPAALALLVSVAGLWLAPVGEPLGETLLRYLKQVIQLDVMLVFVLVPAFFMARGHRLAELAGPLVAGAVFQGIYSLLQGVHFYHPVDLMVALERVFTSNPSILAGSEHLYLGNVLRDMPRLRGTACEPLYLGNFLLLAIPLVWLTSWPRRRQHLIGAGLLVILVLTWSRGAWLAGVAAALLFLLGASQKGNGLPWRPLARGAAIGLSVVAVVWLAGVWAGRPEVWLPWQRLQQTFSMVDWSNLTRLYSMQAAWRAFLLSPLAGIGWGQFGYHFPVLVDPMGLQSMFSWPVVNNFPLAILCETGLLGFGSFLWMVARLNRSVWRRLSGGPQSGRLTVLVLAVAVGGVWLQLLTFSQYNLPHIWVAVGLLLGKLAPAAEKQEN